MRMGCYRNIGSPPASLSNPLEKVNLILSHTPLLCDAISMGPSPELLRCHIVVLLCLQKHQLNRPFWFYKVPTRSQVFYYSNARLSHDARRLGERQEAVF